MKIDESDAEKEDVGSITTSTRKIRPDSESQGPGLPESDSEKPELSAAISPNVSAAISLDGQVPDESGDEKQAAPARELSRSQLLNLW